MNCIALCEGLPFHFLIIRHFLICLSVINKDIRKTGDIWVQPYEDYVVTRFFFVYTDGTLS